MIFNSLIFVVFALVFYGFWPVARRTLNSRWLFIVAGSFFFYGWWDWRYVILLVATGMVDFGAGLGMTRYPSGKKGILILSLAANLGVLGFFKYSGFFVANINGLVAALGGTIHLPEVSLNLPLGISFYTFQSMSYTIDVYRGELRATRNPLHFLAAISMFPHLVAGPIMRASVLLPQLEEERRPTADQLWDGLRLITHGYFKKMVLADNLAPFVNDAFGGHVGVMSCLDWWLVAAMFGFQIYCDFSGYSDIARGLAKWLGYEFSKNFNHPYLATSFREFWTRWHISLSTWFRDYVYIPLGGSRRGEGRSHLNMWITMLLSGLWHGAAWTFVCWGAIHAFFLSIERVTGWPERLAKVPGGRILSLAIVMGLVSVSWVFFRAADMRQAMGIIETMFRFHGATVSVGYTGLAFLALAVSREVYCWNQLSWVWPSQPRIGVACDVVWYACVIVLSIFFRGSGGVFIYFQF